MQNLNSIDILVSNIFNQSQCSAQGQVFHCKLSILQSPSSQPCFSYLHPVYLTQCFPSSDVFFCCEPSSRLPFLVEYPSAGISFLASSSTTVFFLLPLFLAHLHFLFCLFILHAPTFSISTSLMLPVVFPHSVVVYKSLHHTTLHHTNHFTSLFINSFSKGPQKMLLFLLKASL